MSLHGVNLLQQKKADFVKTFFFTHIGKTDKKVNKSVPMKDVFFFGEKKKFDGKKKKKKNQLKLLKVLEFKFLCTFSD